MNSNTLNEILDAQCCTKTLSRQYDYSIILLRLTLDDVARQRDPAKKDLCLSQQFPSRITLLYFNLADYYTLVNAKRSYSLREVILPGKCVTLNIIYVFKISRISLLCILLLDKIAGPRYVREKKS